MFYKTFVRASIIAAVAFSAPVAAQEGRVALQTSIQKVEATAEGDVIAPAASVVPGDQLEFHVTFVNNTGSTVSDLVVVNPVPSTVVLTPASAAQVEVSVDGGTVWGPLATLAMTDSEGNRRPASEGDVTHLRWVIASLAPLEEGKVTYRAFVK